LYLRTRSLDNTYIAALGTLLLLAFLLIGTLVPKVQSFQPAFFFLGAAFLLMETKAVTTLALLFGSTWVVNSVVFFWFLVEILVANLLVAVWTPRRLLPWFAALGFGLLANFVIPVESLLLPSPLARAALSGALVSLPVFFSGVIFASLLRRSSNTPSALASNLMGAVIGGFLEYLSLMIGFNALYLVALALYALASLSWGRGALRVRTS
jgi:hypothetical protein